MATVGSIGTLPPLTKSTNIKSYFKRFDKFVKCNKIEEDIQKATLLTVIGEGGYGLLETLCHPDDPSDKTLEQLKEEFVKHLAPEPSWLLVATVSNNADNVRAKRLRTF